MIAAKPLAIALFRPAAHLQTELEQRFELVELAGLGAGEADRWLESNGGRVSAVVTNGAVGCSRALVEALPNLRIIAIYGVGYDRVDVADARSRGIVVANTPGVLTDDVADLAVGLTICLLRGIAAGDRFVRDGCWQESNYPPQTKVTGKRFGIVGLGRIGKAIADRLSTFGPVAYTGTRAKDVPWAFRGDVLSLAASSDVLIVACAATERTRGLVGEEVLGALGPEGYLVNIARGSIVDEGALVNALESGRLAGAALDVFEDEPNVPAELAGSDRVLLTPHIGSSTRQTRRAMADSLLANVDAFFAGKPIPHEVV